MPDHLIDGEPLSAILDTWTTLAQVGAKTNTIRLASGVTDVLRIHPAKTANIVATLDILTNGRAALGIGPIWNIHVPPIDTPIDQAPKLDPTLKPVLTGGQMVMTSAGSIATRKSIEKYQPLTGMHGHIHESKGVVKIGKTMCF